MKLMKVLSITLAFLLTPGILPAQSVTGLWDITAEFTFGQSAQTVANAVDCEYSKNGITLVQNGNIVSGTVDLNLVNGLTDCPGQMSGMLAATLTGSNFDGTLDGGKDFGTAAVSGSIASSAKAQASAAAATTMMGTVSRISAFGGATGSFAGQQLPAVPVLSPVVVGFMALILFGGTVLLLTRRDRASI